MVPDDHVTWAVRSSVVVSLNVPIAVNCWVSPRGTVGVVGVTEIDSSTAPLTVKVDKPLTPLSVALIVAVPTATVVARPCDPTAFEIVALPGVSDDHATCVVRSRVVVSLNVPTAVNCWVRPSGTFGLVGVTSIESSTAAVTVSWVEPVIRPVDALTVVAPALIVVARPCEPATFEICATVMSDEAHITCAVRSCVVLSLNVPIAVNCWVRPRGTLGLVGVTAIDSSTAAVTVSSVEPVTVPSDAVIMDTPALLVWTRPVASTVAVVVEPDAQVTCAVRSCVELSVNVPVAVSWSVRPSATLGVVGVIAIDTRRAAVTVTRVDP